MERWDQRDWKVEDREGREDQEDLEGRADQVVAGSWEMAADREDEVVESSGPTGRGAADLIQEEVG